MTRQSDLKTLIRARMAVTGERYTAAAAALADEWQSAERYHATVLARFFDGDRLRSIPARRKPRVAVLLSCCVASERAAPTRRLRSTTCCAPPTRTWPRCVANSWTTGSSTAPTVSTGWRTPGQTSTRASPRTCRSTWNAGCARSARAVEGSGTPHVDLERQRSF